MKLIYLEEVLGQLVRDYPFREEPNEADVAIWTKQALRQIDAYDIWEKKALRVTISEYKTVLPGDFHSLDYKQSQLPMRIQGNDAYFGSKQGTTTLYYLALPLDKKGRPMIPDEQTVLDAVVYFCAMKCYGNETLIESQKKNEETEKEKWLQKKLESRGDINGRRIGQEIQKTADNFGSFIAHNKHPRFN